MDRPDLQYVTRVLSKGMSKPIESDLKHMKHMGRYLVRMTELDQIYKWQDMPLKFTVQADSDWAGDKGTRRSVSGGAAYLGGHLLKSWSKEQKHIALSSAEAELYAANKGAAEGLGLKSMAHDICIDFDLEVEIDASAACGIMQRRGLGQVRHIDTQEFWCQKALKEKKF